MAAELHDPVDGGVEAVVIPGGKVDHAKEELCRRRGVEGVPCSSFNEVPCDRDCVWGGGPLGEGFVGGPLCGGDLWGEIGEMAYEVRLRLRGWLVGLGLGGGSVKEGGESVVDSVDDGEFFVRGKDSGLGEIGGSFGAGRGGSGGAGSGGGVVVDGFGANEGVEGVCHAFNLLYMASGADLPKVQDGSISRGDESVRVGVDMAGIGTEFAVEELGKVAVGGEVGVCDFVKADAKDVAVEFEAGGAKEDGEGLRVEPAPGTGEGFEGESGEDLNLPGGEVSFGFVGCEVEVWRSRGVVACPEELSWRWGKVVWRGGKGGEGAVPWSVRTDSFGVSFSRAGFLSVLLVNWAPGGFPELRKGEETNSEPYGDRIPFDFCAGEGLAETLSKAWSLPPRAGVPLGPGAGAVCPRVPS